VGEVEEGLIYFLWPSPGGRGWSPAVGGLVAGEPRVLCREEANERREEGEERREKTTNQYAQVA
jgi:hypothetical protein